MPPVFHTMLPIGHRPHSYLHKTQFVQKSMAFPGQITELYFFNQDYFGSDLSFSQDTSSFERPVACAIISQDASSRIRFIAILSGLIQKSPFLSDLSVLKLSQHQSPSPTFFWQCRNSSVLRLPHALPLCLLLYPP